jgi:hypothetical protein
MFLLNFLALLLQLSILWRSHMWYLIILLLWLSFPWRRHMWCLHLCPLDSLSYGNVIYGTSIVCPATCIIVDTAHTIVNTTDGSIHPFIIFCAFTSMLSCSLFTHNPEAPPSSTLIFFFKIFLGEFVVTFFLFSNVIYISSLVLLTLVGGFFGFSF